MCELIVVGIVLDTAYMNRLGANNPRVIEVLSALNVGQELCTDLALHFIDQFLPPTICIS